jgi:hypothetical protein
MRTLICATTATAAILLAGCGEETSEESPAPSAPEATSEQPADVEETAAPETPEVTEAPPVGAEAAAVPGAIAEENHVRIYFNAMTDPFVSDNQFSQPEEGNRFVAFDMTIEFVDDSGTHSANEFTFGLTDRESFSYEPGAIVGPEPDLALTELRPGEKVRGWVTFEVPAASVLDVLRYQPNFLKDDYIEFKFQ